MEVEKDLIYAWGCRVVVGNKVEKSGIVGVWLLVLQQLLFLSWWWVQGFLVSLFDIHNLQGWSNIKVHLESMIYPIDLGQKVVVGKCV